MMCLGWPTKPDCMARRDQTVVAPTDVTATANSLVCDNATWFWIGLAVVGVGALTK